MREAIILTGRNLRELLISFDQNLNVLMCLLCLRTAYSDETLSAHCWRAYSEGRWFGLVLLPLIDSMFTWQKPDPEFVDEAGVPITSHCHRAYLKEKAKRYLPRIYQDGATP